jgi:hypothetical protein
LLGSDERVSDLTKVNVSRGWLNRLNDLGLSGSNHHSVLLSILRLLLLVVLELFDTYFVEVAVVFLPGHHGSEFRQLVFLRIAYLRLSLGRLYDLLRLLDVVRILHVTLLVRVLYISLIELWVVGVLDLRVLIDSGHLGVLDL